VVAEKSVFLTRRKFLLLSTIIYVALLTLIIFMMPNSLNGKSLLAGITFAHSKRNVVDGKRWKQCHNHIGLFETH